MGISRKQNIIELLILALYQDGHLSVEEDSVLEKALKSFGWDENQGSELQIGELFAAVRDANASEEARESFFQDHIGQIKEAGDSALALEWLGKVFGSDGMDGREEVFFERARKLLF